MKKTLMSLLITGFLCICPNKNNFKNNLENETFSKSKIEFPKESPEFSKDITNEKYLENNIEKIDLFYDEEKLTEELLKNMQSKEFTYRKPKNQEDEKYWYSEDYSQITDLSFQQKRIIYLMLNSLNDQDFVNKIGKIIYYDINNPYAEFGGIVTLSNKKIIFNCFESTLPKKFSNNVYYILPEFADSLPQLAKFHLHATNYYDSLYAGPSTSDIFVMAASLFESNRINEFLITSLKPGKFNIDYFGINAKKEDIPKVIDLGNYSYTISYK